MRKIDYKGWKLLLPDKLSEEEGYSYFDIVQQRDYPLIKTLKENQRSQVLQTVIHGKNLVIKIPIEKNSRYWIRFLTLLRKGEAFKNITGMDTLWADQIPTTHPVMAAEKRQLGMVTDSWLLYDYLEGTSCLDHPEYYAEVVELLIKMHKKGLLHGDPQIRNFLLSDGAIHVIDSNPKATGVMGFDRAYEWAYLRKSAPGIEEYFGKINRWWLYRLAVWYDIQDRRLARARKKIKKNFTLSNSERK